MFFNPFNRLSSRYYLYNENLWHGRWHLYIQTEPGAGVELRGEVWGMYKGGGGGGGGGVRIVHKKNRVLVVT